MRLVIGARDELQSYSTQQASTISDLQTKNSNAMLEVETMRHKVEDLQQVRETFRAESERKYFHCAS